MNQSQGKLQVANELHRSARRNFRRRRTIIKGYGDLWQADLAEMQAYAGENKGYRYILVVIDCFSKYVWTRPVKSKRAVEVANAMRDVIEKAKYHPNNIQTDQGTEFYNKLFYALMKRFAINHYSTYSTKKAAIVERVIRTIKNWLYKEFSSIGRYEWFSILPKITDKYNHTKHRTIGMKPVDVTRHSKVLAYNYLKTVPLRRKLKIGDIVRISKHKGAFEKGYTANWSTELFKIIKVNITNPVTYVIEDMSGRPIKGSFYEMELQKTKNPEIYLVEKILRHRKGKMGLKEVYVKWLGFGDNHNSWIPEKDIV